MLDIVIRGGQVVTPEGVGEWDVAIVGERIAAIALPGTLPTDGARVIDAPGKLVIPGGVDPHVHTSFRIPGPQATMNASAGQVSRAALFGGTTTLMDFANSDGQRTLPEVAAEGQDNWRESYTDYALHIMLRGGASPRVIEQIPEAISAGYASFKVFMTDINPSRKGMMAPFGDIFGVMETLADHGGILSVHAEDHDLISYMWDRLTREGRTDLVNMPLVHSAMSEEIACRRVLGLARHIDGAAVYILHMVSEAGVAAVAEARAEGYPVYGEALHNYLCFTSEMYSRPEGAIYHTYPALQNEEDREALWIGLEEGSVSTVATDESNTPLATKLRLRDIFDTPGGHVGVETRVPIVYTEGVVKRGMPLEQFVAVTSTNAARIMGLYPRKGIIAPGSDADLVVFDPADRRTLRTSDLHGSDYSIWDGWQVEGWPSTVLLRGKVVVDRGELKSEAGSGSFLPCELADEILEGPAV